MIRISGHPGLITPDPETTIIREVYTDDGIIVELTDCDHPRVQVNVHLSRWQLETWIKEIHARKEASVHASGSGSRKV